MIDQCLKKTQGSTVCRQSGLERTDCASTKLDLLATLAVATRAPSETRGQNPIQRQFRGETKTRKTTKHRFLLPSEQIRRTSFQVRRSECVFEFNVQIGYSVWSWSEIKILSIVNLELHSLLNDV